MPIGMLGTKVGMTQVYDVDGNMAPHELETVASIVATVKPKRIFEIGTFDGRTTLNMALNAPDAQIYTLDLPASGVAAH